MRMMSIASGSSGNCIYIGTDNAHILVDAGISKKRIVEGLKLLDLSLDDIDAIVVTHEHDDHIRGIGVVERQSMTPVYGTNGTLEYIKGYQPLGKLPEGIYHSVVPGNDFLVKDIRISPVSISHDAVDPVAYVFSNEDKKIGVLTDIGHYDSNLLESFQNLNAMLIESNHDVNMLMTGPYPYYLKQRILGNRGHLSNESCGRMLGELLNDKLENILLGHLSKENNFPDLAYETVRMEINLSDSSYKADDFNICVAGRDKPSDIISV